MATNENSIRQAVKLLLELYGSLTTSEVKQHLNEVLEFDADDLVQSTTRNEYMIIQKIGNIISHQKAPVQDYLGAYRVDKSQKPAQWTLLEGLSGNQRPLNDASVVKRKQKRAAFTPRKTDWEALKEEHGNLGRAGEEFIVRTEMDRIQQFSPSDVTRISHLSAIQGDGAGYDVSSIDEAGIPIEIEVKTTTGGQDTPFYMTENERRYFELNRYADNLFLYRVFNFNVENNGATAEFIILTPDELFENYKFDPTNYKVSRI
jgi:hypothetical protein